MSFIIKPSTESLESVAGISLAAEIARAIGLNSLLSSQPSLNSSLRSLFGLLVQGRSSFEEIALFRRCALFKKAFDLPFVPAKETLRLYIEKAARTAHILDLVKKANIQLLENITPTPVTVECRGSRYSPSFRHLGS
jgi:hypothetical protein